MLTGYRYRCIKTTGEPCIVPSGGRATVQSRVTGIKRVEDNMEQQKRDENQPATPDLGNDNNGAPRVPTDSEIPEDVKASVAVQASTPDENQHPDAYSKQESPVITPQKSVADVTPLDQLGDTPQWIDCPFCHRRTKTRLEKKGGRLMQT